ncbi:hypothetical protein PYCCODRAFT_1446932 [Trametes coccinea BRFM310]|uniref:Dynamin N-terminal domain-containing protein n=1 Tax=Trametes coccinea (strain BRFM310) TaxID=1353009 RepID=A0A1Y2IDB4_TRAC3|nr:hypothetical protein PYCCODRAFT_1446932 [Trametes coccinea BRFM310]
MRVKFATSRQRNGLYIKPEPEEHLLPPAASQTAPNAQDVDVKPPQSSQPTIAKVTSTANIDKAPQDQDGVATHTTFRKFESVDDLQYAPEEALKEGLAMVKTLRSSLQSLNVGSKMRQEVWMNEIKNLQSQCAPTTMIAVCGATGAGKSSILNAILDDNVVPTSGMRACTAVVTEIAYHKKKSIDGDVSFLTEQEWRDELKVLLDDLVDEEGHVKRSTDLRSDAGIAWSKVHAVYPTLSQEQLVSMSVDQIIARDPKISRLLGTTKHISAPDSRAFAKEVSKYIDSKDQKRGSKKDKKDKDKKKDKRDDGPAYWPLIRQVRVWCNSKALSTGAILVDLPGVADANAARNNIAKDYMKKCDCVWILAPITRAVDDKTARDLMGDAFKMQLLMDGNYDSNTITFIATKCDDISCSEVIRALNLEDDPELEKIEAEIGECKSETNEWKKKKTRAEDAAKDIETQLKRSRTILQEYQDHLKALENGEPFEPQLTAKKTKSTCAKSGAKSESDSSSESDDEPEERPGAGSRKRKHGTDGRQGSSKKRRSGKSSRGSDDDSTMDVDDDEFMDDDDLDFSESGSDEDAQSKSGSTSESDSDSDSGPDSGSEKDEDEDVDEEAEEVTVDSLKAKIEEIKQAIKDGRAQLSEFRRQRKEASDALATLKKRQNKAQREKNAFCSLKRSEFSRDVLKEDFRTGLKDLDDAQQEEQNPDTFDPTVNIRDYNAIDLPVFTVSARDYIRITGQVKGDGDPTCFSKVEDTGVPELQQWCHHLTVASRSRAAHNFLKQLSTFSRNVLGFLEGIGEVTEADRTAMREKWESSMGDVSYADDDDAYDRPFLGGFPSSDPFDQLTLDDLIIHGPGARTGLYSLNKQTKVDKYGEAVGVAPRLVKEFRLLVDDCVEELQERFKDGLEERCQVGAANQACTGALTAQVGGVSFLHSCMFIVESPAALRRHGSWRQDLNVELTNPFTRQIASSWARVFEADLFASFEQTATKAIEQLIDDIAESAAPGLKERARGQGELAMEEAKVALKKMLEVVRETMNNEQKEVSRCLAPHVQAQLADGYERAMEERGRGSVARQKAVFHDYIARVKDHVFTGAADVLMGRLSKAAEAVGEALDESLEQLARKVEVSMAVLWEGHRDDPQQANAREKVVQTVSDILRQLELWREAERLSHTKSGGEAPPPSENLQPMDVTA